MDVGNEERFRAVVSEVLAVPAEQVTDDLSPETAATWDSLNHINLICALEEAFEVRLPTDSLGDSQSIPQLRTLLVERGVAL